VKSINAEFLRHAANDPEFLYSIPPRQFEEFVAEVFARQGYEVNLTPATRDGGSDIRVAKNDSLGSFLYIVECKRYARDRPVGVQLVRQLHGVADVMRANGSILVTTSYFTRDAKQFASEIRYQMNLRDYVDVHQWLKDFRDR
jgi:restriction system protein